MPIRSLCEPCRTLATSLQPLSAHSGLLPMLDLDGQRLYRCNCCGAFATSPDKENTGWSFNIHGQPVSTDEPC